MNEQSNDKSGEDPIESSAEESAAASTDEVTEESSAESSAESTEESSAESTEESSPESTEESSPESAEESSPESAEESSPESSAESSPESAEESSPESSEESIPESAEASVAGTTGETTEDTGGQASGGDDAEAQLPVVHGTVKWFNAEKGFGFIVADDGSGDVFLHLSALRQAGLETVAGGATIVCAVSRGPKGFQVDRVIEVDESTAAPSVQPRPRSPLGYDRPRHAPLTDVGEFVMATVKWFNPNKGFGFITVDESSPDVFVHMQTLRRCGVATLDSGQEVRVRIGQGAKGPQVSDIEVG